MRGIPGIGERIDQRRVTLGWRSLTDFALDTRHSPQVVHAWVRRGQIPKWAMLERLAVELQCPLAWLLLGDQVFEAIPGLQGFYKELYGQPLDPPADTPGGGTPERPSRGISTLQGLDDEKANWRFRFWPTPENSPR